MSTEKGSLVAERTLKALLFFTEHKTLSLTEISDLLGISQTATYRLVYTLHEMGFIKRDTDTKRYSLDSLILKLSSMIEPNLRSISKPIIEELAQKIEESVYLSIPFNDINYMFIEKADSPFPLQWARNIGDFQDIHAGSPGKAHLAFMQEKELQELLPKLKFNLLTESTISDMETLKAELERVRHNKYAVSKGEHREGVVGISVPIFDSQKKKLIAVLSTFMADTRYEEDQLDMYVSILQKCAEEIGSFIWE